MDECASRRPSPGLEWAARLLGRPWTILILTSLERGPLRFTELVTVLDGVSTNLLSERLRTLSGQQLISRTTTSPATYVLTASGRSLSSVLRGLERWGDETLNQDDSDS